jgi:hypothetical protein
LKYQLDHAASERVGKPRVILNMLVPEPGSTFQEKHRCLYPGGPLRATRFEELIERYVRPFVGELTVESTQVPDKHRFTTGIGCLASIPGSSVYVARNYYMLTGRARVLVRPGSSSQRPTAAAIRTKVFPVGASRFKFKACFTTTPASEDEVMVPRHVIPPWFESLNSFVVDVGSLAE